MTTDTPQPVIYHNPRCSKSRQTLELLQQQGKEPVVIEYLKHTPSVGDLRKILELLGLQPIGLVRSKEAIFEELGIGQWDAGAGDYDARVIAAMTANPGLIERPIVISGNQARIGRPPQCVLEIL